MLGNSYKAMSYYLSFVSDQNWRQEKLSEKIGRPLFVRQGKAVEAEKNVW